MAKRTQRNATVRRGRNSGDVLRETRPPCHTCGALTPPRRLVDGNCTECVERFHETAPQVGINE
jgi:hypothetical protein